MSGKGSKPRPIPEPEKFRDNWDRIFGKKKDDHPEQPVRKPS